MPEVLIQYYWLINENSDLPWIELTRDIDAALFFHFYLIHLIVILFIENLAYIFLNLIELDSEFEVVRRLTV